MNVLTNGDWFFMLAWTLAVMIATASFMHETYVVPLRRRLEATEDREEDLHVRLARQEDDGPLRVRIER